MPFNGSGVFQRVRNWVADAAAGIKIRADFHDAEDDGFAQGLSNCITRDGQSTILQNIPFNNKRVTNLADPVNDQDAATKASVAALTSDKFSTHGGTIDGDLTIKKNNPTLFLDGVTGDTEAIYGQKNEKNRWSLLLGNSTPETGANVGSDFYLIRYADDGTYLDNVLTGIRSTGLLSVRADPTATLGIATKNYVDVAAANAGANKVLKTGDTMTGALNSAGSGGGITTTAGMSGSFNVMNTPGVSHAYMTFFAGGYFAANFGVAADGNFYMGGFSHGATMYKFWTTRDFASVPGGVRFSGVADYTHGANEELREPYAGGIVTGGSGVDIISTYYTIVRRYRFLQQFNGSSWVTLGY